MSPFSCPRATWSRSQATTIPGDCEPKPMQRVASCPSTTSLRSFLYSSETLTGPHHAELFPINYCVHHLQANFILGEGVEKTESDTIFLISSALGYFFGSGGGVKPFQTPSMMYLDMVASPLRGAFL